VGSTIDERCAWRWIPTTNQNVNDSICTYSRQQVCGLDGQPAACKPHTLLTQVQTASKLQAPHTRTACSWTHGTGVLATLQDCPTDPTLQQAFGRRTPLPACLSSADSRSVTAAAERVRTSTVRVECQHLWPQQEWPTAALPPCHNPDCDPGADAGHCAAGCGRPWQPVKQLWRLIYNCSAYSALLKTALALLFSTVQVHICICGAAVGCIYSTFNAGSPATGE
jgi:hypothetical protein